MIDRYTSRLLLLHDVLVFQFKLALDGLRDVFLSPISLLVALLGVLIGRCDPGKYFRRLLELGYTSDRWINLFNAYSEEDGPPSDTLVRKAETIVKKEPVDLMQEESTQNDADRTDRLLPPAS